MRQEESRASDNVDKFRRLILCCPRFLHDGATVYTANTTDLSQELSMFFGQCDLQISRRLNSFSDKTFILVTNQIRKL